MKGKGKAKLFGENSERTMHVVKINLQSQPYMHWNIHSTDTQNILLQDLALPDDGIHGLPKHAGGDFVYLLCIHSSVCKFGFIY